MNNSQTILPITTGDPLPCPMPGCGGIAEMAFYASRNDFWVRCQKNIFHAGPHRETEAEALTAWNRFR